MVRRRTYLAAFPLFLPNQTQIFVRKRHTNDFHKWFVPYCSNINPGKWKRKTPHINAFYLHEFRHHAAAPAGYPGSELGGTNDHISIQSPLYVDGGFDPSPFLSCTLQGTDCLVRIWPVLRDFDGPNPFPTLFLVGFRCHSAIAVLAAAVILFIAISMDGRSGSHLKILALVFAVVFR